MIVSVIGTLLAIAVPTLGRTIRVSKLTEASEQLDALYRATAAYYAVPRELEGGRTAHCLPPPAGPTPAVPSVQPIAVDFADKAATGAATWVALGFTPSDPLRFRYTYLPSAWGCSLPRGGVPVQISLRAEADLDGDGVYSQYERRAQILMSGELRPELVLHVEDRVE